MSSIYIVNFNTYPCGCGGYIYYNHIHYHIKPFTQLDDAISFIHSLIDEYGIHEHGICEIQHWLIGDPETEYEKIFEKYFPITILCNNRGDIYKYIANGEELIWTPRDLIEYKGNFDKGDIVDYYHKGEYRGRYVVVDTPHTIYSHIESNLTGREIEYPSGYLILGYNPYLLNNDLETKHKPYTSDDITGVYDEDLIPVMGNDVDAEFFEGLSVYGKFYTRTYEDFSCISETDCVDILFKLYFVDEDYDGFRDHIKYLKSKIEERDKEK